MPPQFSSKKTVFSLAFTLGLLFTGFAQAAPLQQQPTQVAANNPATAKALPDPILEPMELSPSLAPDAAQSPKVQAGPATSEIDGKDPLKARAVVVDIQSDTLNYNKDTDLYTATGSAHVVISEQNSELTADKVIYDQTKGLLFAEGHVVITKNGRKTEGIYAKIDLTRESALINDAVTTIQAVRVKAKEALVDSNYVRLEKGKFIINGKYLSTLMSKNGGGLGGTGKVTGKGSNQARLNREYYQQIRNNQQILNQIDPNLAIANKALETQTLDFNEDKKSRFQLKVKEIDVTRGEDGYDQIDLKWPSIYMGRFKIATMPSNDFSYDEETKQLQYLGPDIGFNSNYGGFYAGPGWDFHVGRAGSIRVSPFASFGGAGSRFGTPQKQGVGPGIGGIVHYRDPDTYMDLGYNSRVGYPVFFGDRRLFGDTTHLMASYRDFYQNGLLGYTERPNYIAQVTDYRVLKQYKNFQLTSFESLGYAKDNFTPTNQAKYFINPTSNKEQAAGRLQLQAQLQNVQPLLRVGQHLNFGFRGLLSFAGYSTGNYLALARIGPTMHFDLLHGRVNTTMGYNVTASLGESPFVFDAYYGGSQNLTVNNTFRVNDYLTIGTSNNFNLLRDNARKALAVGNTIYFLVGPKDVKVNLAFDVISKRSYFGINFYPGTGNTVIDFDRMKMYQPQNYSGQMVPPTQ